MALTVAAGTASGADWKSAQAPIMTRWARDVTPKNALPDYPRPQMVRKDWLNLNGVWELATPSADVPVKPGLKLDGSILVPFPVESALSGVMKQTDRLVYRRTFKVPEQWKGRRVLLHFGAVDWEATVYVNGKELGTHRGGFDGFSFDITDALKPGANQEVIVKVFDPTDAGSQPRGKQINKPHGIFYVPCTGIWQTVWLEPVPQASINDITIKTDLDTSTVMVAVQTSVPADKTRVRISVLDAGKEVASGSGAPGEEIKIAIPNLKTWSPDSPFLYDLKVSLAQDDKDVDSIASYFGMRKVEMKNDGKVNRLYLNGKPLFEMGTLDQGYWPDGIYTAPTDAALRYDIEITKELGFNLIRKHVKVEPARWYYWTDKLGMLVWQDMPSGDNKTSESQVQHEVELKQLVQQHWNHPSIISWVVFNEGWGQFDTERLTDLVKKMDPSRLANNASGWTDKNVGDVVDLHQYPGPGTPPNEPHRASVLGEFGGLALKVEGHTWETKTFGYQTMSTTESLTETYERLLARVWALAKDGLCAAVYTQITDVETECNGLLTYDRAIIKPDAKRVREANLGHIVPVEHKMVVPTARNSREISWKYTNEKPVEGWFKPDFDDSQWKAGCGGFGTEGTPGAVITTEWKTPEIYLRREFELPANVDLDSLYLLVHHDENVRVWINGVSAAKENGYTFDYVAIPISPESRAALKPGQKNLIAVSCHQTNGGQYIDAGFESIKELKH